MIPQKWNIIPHCYILFATYMCRLLLCEKITYTLFGVHTKGQSQIPRIYLWN